MELLKKLLNENPKAVRNVSKFNPYVLTKDTTRRPDFSMGTEYEFEVKFGVQFIVDHVDDLSLDGFSRYKEQACKSVQNMVYGEIVEDLRKILSKVYTMDCADYDSDQRKQDALKKITDLIGKLAG
jgi:hypothetical protein